MSWLCICGLINCGLNDKCAAVLTWKSIEHYQVSANSLDWHMIHVAIKEFKWELEAFERTYKYDKK